MRWFSYIFILATCLLGASTLQAKADTSSNPLNVSFADTLNAADYLVLGVFTDNKLGKFGQQLDSKSNGGLTHAISATDFNAKLGGTQLVVAPVATGYKQILLLGLGSQGESVSDLDLQHAGGNALQAAVKAFKSVPQIAVDLNAEHTAQLAFGAKLAGYYFDKYYTDEKRKKRQQAVAIVSADPAKSSSIFAQQLEPLANAVWFTRDISNEPANVIYPESFVARWKSHFKGIKNLKVKVIDEK